MYLKYFFLIILVFKAFSATSQVKVVDKFSDFETVYLKSLSKDTVYIVNFWATWCAPCVAELPYFEALKEKYKDKNIKLVLVSLDSPKTIDSRVIPFIEKNKIKAEVIVLADSKTYKWIDKIDAKWSGAIPITLFLSGKKKYFYEKQYEGLQDLEGDLFKIYKTKTR